MKNLEEVLITDDNQLLAIFLGFIQSLYFWFRKVSQRTRFHPKIAWKIERCKDRAWIIYLLVLKINMFIPISIASARQNNTVFKKPKYIWQVVRRLLHCMLLFLIAHGTGELTPLLNVYFLLVKNNGKPKPLYYPTRVVPQGASGSNYTLTIT